jgi:hypothetical protein
MLLIEIAGRQGLFGTLRGNRMFEFRQSVLCLKTETVFQD